MDKNSILLYILENQMNWFTRRYYLRLVTFSVIEENNPESVTVNLYEWEACLGPGLAWPYWKAQVENQACKTLQTPELQKKTVFTFCNLRPQSSSSISYSPNPLKHEIIQDRTQWLEKTWPWPCSTDLLSHNWQGAENHNSSSHEYVSL